MKMIVQRNQMIYLMIVFFDFDFQTIKHFKTRLNFLLYDFSKPKFKV